jgi:hypothetical protein
MQLVYSDDFLRVTSLGDTSLPNIILCFTGISQGMGGIGAEEFVGSTKMPGFSAIFISDLRRSWFNDFPPSLLIDAIGDLVEGKRIVSIGNSMGGYGAIWATGHFNVSTAIAFAPQFSVHPKVVPEETRWQEYRRKISVWRDESLQPYVNDETDYFLFHGDADELHWRNFPNKPNVANILLPESGHNPAAKLKAVGKLSATFQKCVAGKNPIEILADSGVQPKLL